MPVRRTSGGDHGSLLPTPSAQTYGSNQGGAAGRTGAVRASVGVMLTTVCAPTPTASTGGPESNPLTGPKLVTVVNNILTPTATANLTCSSMQKWAGARELMDLLEKVVERYGNIATPTARDWRSGSASEATLSRNSRPLNEQLHSCGITKVQDWLAIVEWQMAFPTGWHGAGSAPTATPSSCLSLPLSSGESRKSTRRGGGKGGS